MAAVATMDERKINRLVEERKQLEERERVHKVEKRCRYGDADACKALASMYRFTCGNAAEAIASAASKLDTPSKKVAPQALTACSKLANLYLRGVGVEQNAGNAMKLLHFGCQHQHVNSCFTAGVLRNFGFPDGGQEQVSAANRIEVDKGMANDYLTVACFGGHGTACNLLAQNFNEVKPPTQQSKATTAGLFHRACELNHVASCANFGLMCLYGVGMRQPDHSLAKKYLTRACDAKHIAACNGLQTLTRMLKELDDASQNDAGPAADKSGGA